jgi:diadenosine tetraphosphate (Ap4A) HIT family hydrolase
MRGAIEQRAFMLPLDRQLWHPLAMPATDCPFCQPLPPERILVSSDAFVAFLDGFPVTLGHALVIPKRHVASLFDLPKPEYRELWVRVAELRKKLAEKFRPTAFNIGVNDGAGAGQTVGHAHVHVIPRYAGDVPDPRGGIRWIIPDKAKYW